jgi:integrase
VGTVFRKTYTKIVPDDAVVIEENGALFARVTSSKGKTKTFPILRGRDGEQRIRVTCSRYVAKFRDGRGVVRTISTGCQEEGSARNVLRELERRSELVRSGVISPEEDQITVQQDVPLLEHKEAYLLHLRIKETAELHRRNVSARLERLFGECHLSLLNDISAERLEQWLLNAEELGLGARTRNTYRSALCAFCNWAVKSSRLSTNPVSNVSPANEKADRRHQRRSLTEIEIEQLLDSAERRPLLEALTVRRGKNIGKPLAKVKPDVRVRLLRLGKERRLIYLTLLSTGLRKSELASITVNQFRDEPSGAFIELHASDEKNRNGALIPVRHDLAVQIRAWIKETDSPSAKETENSGNRRLFRVPDALDKIFNKDIELAGIPKTDKRGYVADVHGLRTTFCSLLSKAGVQPKTVQLAMRHGSIDLTMETYTDPALLDLHSAVSSLPLANQISRREVLEKADTVIQLAPDLAPAWHKRSTEQPLSETLADAAHSGGDSSKLSVSALHESRRATSSQKDETALSKRVRGIEPPPEAWEASVLPLNYTRDEWRHYHGRTVACK